MLQNRWQLKNTRYVELRGNGSIWKYLEVFWKYWKTPKIGIYTYAILTNLSHYFITILRNILNTIIND
jgi:hypothetical protein